TDLPGAIADYRHALAHQGIVILVSDLLVPSDDFEALAALGGGGITAAVLHLVDVEDAAPGFRGPLELRDRETGETLALAVTPALLQRYVAQFETRFRALAAHCAAHGVRYGRIATDVPPADLVLEILERGFARDSSAEPDPTGRVPRLRRGCTVQMVEQDRLARHSHGKDEA
ncbi:MAG: hypothetical protein JOZ41_11440, partial [Chloroflexi bacterium]|nr:hypothetical protein [Chloroflexota bacterium]